MSDLAFEVLDAHAEPFAAVPTIMFRLRITQPSGVPVHAVALRCQIRIEPQLRRYDPIEEERLVEVFGEPPQWGQSLKPFLWRMFPWKNGCPEESGRSGSAASRPLGSIPIGATALSKKLLFVIFTRAPVPTVVVCTKPWLPM